MKNKLFAYKIGLAVVGLFTVGMLIFLIIQGSSAKKDNQTTKSAKSISDQLDRYINSNGDIPNSLSDAGIKNVPSSISYSKDGDNRYKFCATYRLQNSDYSPSDLAFEAYTHSSSHRSSDWATFNDAESAFIPGWHQKGENCLTVKPYMYNSADMGSNGDSGATIDYDAPIVEPGTQCGIAYGSSLTFDKIESITPPSGSTAGSVTVDGYQSTKTYKLSPSLNVFDYNCTSLGVNSVAKSDYADLYFSADNPDTVSVIVKE